MPKVVLVILSVLVIIVLLVVIVSMIANYKEIEYKEAARYS